MAVCFVSRVRGHCFLHEDCNRRAMRTEAGRVAHPFFLFFIPHDSEGAPSLGCAQGKLFAESAVLVFARGAKGGAPSVLLGDRKTKRKKPRERVGHPAAMRQ